MQDKGGIYKGKGNQSQSIAVSRIRLRQEKIDCKLQRNDYMERSGHFALARIGNCCCSEVATGVPTYINFASDGRHKTDHNF